MKKLMIALALIASTIVNASTDVYTFRTQLKYPAIGTTAFVPAATPVVGTLTVNTDDPTNVTAKLVITLKKTKTTYTMVLNDPIAYAVFGSRTSNCATELKFVNEDPSSGLTELTFYGWGIMRTKQTGGCTPCGDTTAVCSRVARLTGIISGRYICPCGGNFIEWDGTCEIGNDLTDSMVVYGASATFALKSVDGKTW